MFHWQILLGLAGGIAEILWETGAGRETAVQLAGLAVRVVGTCAVFYALFLCRMLGAGDIKLMALCTGLLGMGPGLRVIFSGLLLAALRDDLEAGLSVAADGEDRKLCDPLRKSRAASGISGAGGQEKYPAAGALAVPGILYMAVCRIFLRR